MSEIPILRHPNLSAGMAWLGEARQGKARRGMARQAWRGQARYGLAWPGLAWQARHGKAGLGAAWLGKARQAGHGMARPGEARRGRHGRAWRGKAWHGGAGKARIFLKGGKYPQRLHTRFDISSCSFNLRRARLVRLSASTPRQEPDNEKWRSQRDDRRSADSLMVGGEP